VRERIAEKKTNKRNPNRISPQQGELFTRQPHVPRKSYAEGDKKPQFRFSPVHGCSTRNCGTFNCAGNDGASTDHKGS
jgi:hypothetical protein